MAIMMVASQTPTGSVPSLMYDKDAPIAYDVDVAVDMEGDAEEDVQEQAIDGLASVQSGSHVLAWVCMMVAADTDYGPEPSAKVDKDCLRCGFFHIGCEFLADTDNGLEPSALVGKDAPTAFDVDAAVDKECASCWKVTCGQSAAFLMPPPPCCTNAKSIPRPSGLSPNFSVNLFCDLCLQMFQCCRP